MYNVTLSLDPAARQPLYEQLYRYFAGEISAGRLRRGEKLPSKRMLCEHLGISRSTVETAYSMLAADGYVVARARSGFYVHDFMPNAAPVLPAAPPAPQRASPRPKFDFSTASVDTSLFPYSSWARLNREVVYSSPELLQRGDMQGDLVLRQALCDFWGQYRGVRCSPEQIVVGAGMEYLTGLLVQLMGRSAVFAVEDPGYASMVDTLHINGRGIVFIPPDERGMSAELLEKSGACAAYITPSHQFPLGMTMPAGRRAQLLQWACAAPGRYVIEDDYDSEFRHFSRPVPAMQGMDTDGRVVYIGTFSRSIAPSIRIAYMVLPDELLTRYRELFAHSSSTVSRYEQAVMARFVSEGFYTRYLRRAGSLYRRRCRRLCDALMQIPGASVSGNGGGLHFLLTVPRYSEAELVERARAHGIALRALSSYSRRCPVPPSTLVIGYGGLDDRLIDEAAQTLALAWE